MMEIQPKTQIGTTTGTVICSIGTYSTGISPPMPPSTSYPIQLATKRKTLTCVHSYRDIRITTDTTEAWGSGYLDEALLDAAGLLEFPEYYAYIIERDQEPVPPAERVPIGEQTLQKQVIDNDDILFSTNEQFIPPVSNAHIKLDLGSQLERSSFLASNGSDPQLIVYGNRVTLTASYETTGLFPGGYLFKSYPEFARPKEGGQSDCISWNQNNEQKYTSQIPSKTGLFINVTYSKKYEQSKITNYDANNDGIVNIMDIWHVNGKGTFETSSYVYETVKKQTDLIATGLFGDVKVNYLNRDIKLQDELAIYKADRAAFFIKEGSFITFSFSAKLVQIIQQQSSSENQQTVHRLFSTITQKLLPPNMKYMPVRTEQQEYAAMCLFKDIYDKSLAVEVAISGILNKYDCEFQRTYILDNYKNLTSNEEPNALPTDPKEPDSHIDEVIIKHDGKLASSSSQIYTITNVFNQIQLIAPFNQHGHVYNTYYIVDDGTCKVCVFNQYFETQRQATSTQEIGLLPDAVLPTDGKSMGFPASVYRNAGGYIIWLGIFSKLKKLVSVVGKGVSQMNDKIVKQIMSITNALLQSLGPAGCMVAKGISAGSSAVDALF
ncbi:MAG: hypothetical protein EZS28_024753 [Streblomastix strix]|uniref:EF-hand domain-containing protein n=1 Tax=Streblomastix strix TaxID=222440 RepID=A0A5J4VB27_9EUKA|nr:MAG: hypothetical protein EZS28_024753 [Streblomastix strix]